MSSLKDMTDKELAAFCADLSNPLSERQLASAIYAERQRNKINPELQRAATRYNRFPLI